MIVLSLCIDNVDAYKECTMQIQLRSFYSPAGMFMNFTYKDMT